jgi:hypothetical protein
LGSTFLYVSIRQTKQPTAKRPVPTAASQRSKNVYSLAILVESRHPHRIDSGHKINEKKSAARNETFTFLVNGKLSFGDILTFFLQGFM